MNKKIRPNFKRKMPKSLADLFVGSSAAEYVLEHPNALRLLRVISISVLLLPMVVYGALACFAFDIEGKGWQTILGVIGSISLGVGLFNISSAWIDQYLGHRFTIICFAVGALMITVSCLLICDLNNVLEWLV